MNIRFTQVLPLVIQAAIFVTHSNAQTELASTPFYNCVTNTSNTSCYLPGLSNDQYYQVSFPLAINLRSLSTVTRAPSQQPYSGIRPLHQRQ